MMDKNNIHLKLLRIGSFEKGVWKEYPKEQLKKYHDSGEGLIKLPKSASILVGIKEVQDKIDSRKKELDTEYKFLTAKPENTLGKNKARFDKYLLRNKNEIAEIDKIKLPYADVKWIWSTVKSNIEFKDTDFNTDFTTGTVENWFTIRELLEGGGFAYIEAFHSKENINLANSGGQGLLVQATGSPEILAVVWSDSEGNDLKGKTLYAGSTVRLNVYTKGLYGQEIEIQLMNDDWLDDKLPAFPRTSGVSPDINVSPNNKDKQDYPNMPANTYFEREVDAIKLEVGKHIIPKAAILGQLGDNGKTTENTMVQKCEFNVYLDPFWRAKIYADSKQIKIYAKVKNAAAKDYKVFDENFIIIDGTAVVESELTDSGNKPVVVGKIEINDADFKHCRYNKITLKKQASDDPDVVIFDSSVVENRRRPKLEVDIIAGQKETYLMDFVLKTEECVQKPKHINHEVLINNYTNSVYKLVIDSGSNASHVKKDESKLVKTEVTSTNSFNYFGGAQSTKNLEIVQNSGQINVRRDQIAFDAFYNYDINFNAGALSAFWGIWKYFWLPKLGDDKIYKIDGQVSSCAFDKPLHIKIYPDIKWSFAIGWNVTKDQLSVLRPSWDQKNTIEKYEIKAKKISKKISKNQISEDKIKEINDKTLKTYQASQGGKLPAAEPEKPKKGKLSVVIDILKETDISLNVQLYKEPEEKNTLKLTDDFIKNAFNTKLWVDIYEIVERIARAMDGKEDTPEDEAGGDAKMKEYIELNKHRRDDSVKKLIKALTDPPQEVEILYPKIALGGGWQYEKVSGKDYPKLQGRAGLGYEITLDAKPIIGMEIRWHILDLLCRRHPIAYAVLAAVKTILTALGDNPDGIKLDFWVKGEINTLIKFKGNALSESKEISAKGDTHITAGIDIAIIIQGKVVKGKYTAVAKVGVGAGAEVGLVLAIGIGYDNLKGFWIQPSFTFDGIKLFFDAVAETKIYKSKKNKNGDYEEDEVVSVGGSFHAEITMLQKTFETDKLYFSTEVK